MTTTDDTDWWFLKLTKKFFIDQHGCAKNQVDGELIIARLENLGFVQTLNVEDSDLIIVNSCGFIKTAKEESLKAYCEGNLVGKQSTAHLWLEDSKSYTAKGKLHKYVSTFAGYFPAGAPKYSAVCVVVSKLSSVYPKCMAVPQKVVKELAEK